MDLENKKDAKVDFIDYDNLHMTMEGVEDQNKWESDDQNDIEIDKMEAILTQIASNMDKHQHDITKIDGDLTKLYNFNATQHEYNTKIDEKFNDLNNEVSYLKSRIVISENERTSTAKYNAKLILEEKMLREQCKRYEEDQAAKAEEMKQLISRFEKN